MRTLTILGVPSAMLIVLATVAGCGLPMPSPAALPRATESMPATTSMSVPASLPTTVPTSVPTSTPPLTSTSAGAPRCGDVRKRDATGYEIPPAVLNEVVAVHDAACARDYRSLRGHMDTHFSGTSPEAAITELRRHGGTSLTILAQTLETAAKADQGGWVYCHPHGAVAIFARGTLDHPTQWSDFSLTGKPEYGMC